MDLSKKYHILSKSEFEIFIDELKNSEGSIKFFSFDKEYFYYPEPEIIILLYELENCMRDFKDVFSSLDKFSKNQLTQSLLIDEIKSTNEIENIFSTRHDIFYLMNKNNLPLKKDSNKTISLINGYLYYFSSYDIDTLESIRDAYDNIILPTLDSKRDYPDGKLFRNNPVSITDGISIVHTGFKNEELINNGLEEFINVYSNKNVNLFLRGLISHFMFETIHPFYDGNGRMGRYFLSALFMKEKGNEYGMLISKTLLKNKSKYYHALDIGRKYDQGGCINEYLKVITSLLIEGVKDTIKEINNKIEDIKKYNVIGLTKKEKNIFDVLLSSSILSFYGVSLEEIAFYSNSSRRTIVSTLKKFSEKYKIKREIFGKKVFYSFDLSSLNF